MSQKYARGGVTVAIGQSHEVSLPPGIFRGRATCMHFDTNMCFLLPPSMTGMRNIVAFAQRHPGAAMLVNGHTDLVGDAPSNLTLSNERAASVSAFLLQQVDAWLAWYQSGDPGKRWSYREDQNMLATVVDPSGAPYYAGAITSANDAATQDATRRFQQDHGLAADGQPGPDTRRALVTAYMALEGTSLPASTPIQQHGCGKSHPIDQTTAADQGNRRVEIFLFDGDVDPPPQATCPPGGCAEYAQWIANPEEDIDLCTACADLLVIVQDNAAPPNRIARAQVTIDRPGTGAQTTGADGTTTFTSVSPGPVHITAVYGSITKETDATISAGVQPRASAYQKASFVETEDQASPDGGANVAVVTLAPRLRISMFDFNAPFITKVSPMTLDTTMIDALADARIDDYSLVHTIGFAGIDPTTQKAKPPTYQGFAPGGVAKNADAFLAAFVPALQAKKIQVIAGYEVVDKGTVAGHTDFTRWMASASDADVRAHADDIVAFFANKSIDIDGIGFDIEANGLGGGQTIDNFKALFGALAAKFRVIYYDTAPFKGADGQGSTKNMAPLLYALANVAANVIARPMCYNGVVQTKSQISDTIDLELGVSSAAHLQLAIDVNRTSDADVIDLCTTLFRPKQVGMTVYTMPWPKLSTAEQQLPQAEQDALLKKRTQAAQTAHIARVKSYEAALNPAGTAAPGSAGQPLQVPNP